MSTRSRIGVLFEVTREMIEAARALDWENDRFPDEYYADLYRVMRGLAPGAIPEPVVRPGRNPYAEGGR